MPVSTRSATSSDTSVSLVPSTFVCEGRTHRYQLPTRGVTKGTVVFLAGCCRMPQGFWPASPKATDCLGFPEDVSHTKQVLAKGYAMLVPMPNDQKVLGFSFSAGDHNSLVRIIECFMNTHPTLKTKPIILAGASAGGSMAVRIMGHLKKWHVAGIIAEVATNAEVPDDDPRFPPVAFVVMERDTDSHVEARQRVASLRKGGGRGAMVVSPIRQIGPTYFSDRIPGVTAATSKGVTDSLRKIGMLDASGRLTKNPKDTGAWTAAFDKACEARGFTNFAIRTSPFMQALLVAWAQHEHVADYTTAALTWLESGGDFKELATEFAVTKPTGFRV